jgi:hypothetical protein
MAKSKHQRSMAQLDLFAQARSPAHVSREKARLEHIAELEASCRADGRDTDWAHPTTLQIGDRGMLFGQPCEVVLVGYAYVKVRQALSEDHWVGGYWITQREPRRG